MNKKGQKPINLKEEAVEVITTTVIDKIPDYENVVGQDSLTRLDDKPRNKGNKNNRNNNQNRNKNNNDRRDRTDRGGERGERGERSERGDQRPPQQGKNRPEGKKDNAQGVQAKPKVVQAPPADGQPAGEVKTSGNRNNRNRNNRRKKPTDKPKNE
ncbi:hypothetical protein D3C86_1753920 [compost metagenome]